MSVKIRSKKVLNKITIKKFKLCKYLWIPRIQPTMALYLTNINPKEISPEGLQKNRENNSQNP